MPEGPHLISVPLFSPPPEQRLSLGCSLVCSFSLPSPAVCLRTQMSSVPDMEAILVNLHLVPTSLCNLNSKVRITVSLAVTG